MNEKQEKLLESWGVSLESWEAREKHLVSWVKCFEKQLAGWVDRLESRVKRLESQNKCLESRIEHLERGF